MKNAILILAGLLFVASMAIADAKWPESYVPGTPTAGDRQGGDTLADATAIPGFPYSNTGDTSNALDDYDEVCPYGGSTSPDVVYVWDACADGEIEISMCVGSAYDTKIYVYENDASTLVACNDDLCPGWISELSVASGEPVPVSSGNSYFVVVDGYGGDMGAYTIDMTGPECTTAAQSTDWGLVKSLY
ncbi:MAG: hypothetical protein QGG80_00150 [Candidatus Krumholzibacteria bacterium]|jgi:hypothetical protein|nr:hypothetical protein [Candidatus Krumholzibacteria bacterium]